MKSNDSDIFVIGMPGYSEEDAPQIGAVQLVHQCKYSVLKGETPFSKFGWKVAAVHFNDDPYEDLAGELL